MIAAVTIKPHSGDSDDEGGQVNKPKTKKKYTPRDESKGDAALAV